MICQIFWFFRLKCWFKGQIISTTHLSLPNACKLMCFDRNVNGNRDVKILIGIIGHCTDQRNLLYWVDYFADALKPYSYPVSEFLTKWYNSCTLDLILFSFHSFMKNGVRKQNVFQSLSMIPLDDIATFT